MGVLVSECEGVNVVGLMEGSQQPVPAPFLIKTYQLVDDPSTDHIVSWGEDDSTFVVWRAPEFSRDLLPNYFKHNNFSSFVRQLNTYGFRKIVPERWEFANDFFKKGKKHLLCEIQRRKTPHHLIIQNQHQLAYNNNNNYLPDHPHHHYYLHPDHHHHHHLALIRSNHHQHPSWSKQDLDQNNLWDPPSASSFPRPRYNHHDQQQQQQHASSNYIPKDHQLQPSSFITSSTTRAEEVVLSLQEDNQKLRRSNCVLHSELTHMKKLYNDIIYFLQNHVKPAAPPAAANSAADHHHHQFLAPCSNSAGDLPAPKQQQLVHIDIVELNTSGTSCCNDDDQSHSHSHEEADYSLMKNSSSTSDDQNSADQEAVMSSSTTTIKIFGVPLLIGKKRLYSQILI